MEVYLSRLPPQFTEQSLNRSLKPVLAELGICDVLCQKNLHKKWAIVTFLERSDGQRFLNRYGDIRHGNQHQPRLMLANLLVSCKESHNKPSPYVLRCLAKTKNDRSNPQTAPRPPEAVIKFTLMGLQCGYLTYTPSGQLYFKPELSWSWWSKSSLRLINKTIVIKYNEWRLEIPFISVYELIVSTYARGPATLTFTLMESPRLYSSNVEDNLLASINTLALTNGRSKMNVAPLTRLTALDELHEDIVGYCLVYQVSVPFDGNFESSVDAIRARGDIAVSYYNFPDDRRFMMAEYSFPFYLDSFNTQLAFSCLERKEAVLSDDEKAHGTGPKLSTSHGEGKVIPFDLAYQLQAMVQNGYLLPTVAEQLLGRIMAINRASHDGQDSGSANTTASAPTRITGAAVRRFLDRIPFPGPYVPADSFSVDHLVSGLLAEQRSLDAEEAHMRYQMFLDADMAGMDGAEAMKRRDDNAQVPICRILVTPTRVLLQGPELEAQNPVLRRYARSKASTSGRSVTETFVRVSFADEDGSSIRLTPRVNNDKVFAKFKETLDKGIMLYSQLLRGPVNSVLYRFLGFSGSSLRAHTAWLSNIEYEETIRELGDFSRLRSPARCAARIGQAFSETPWTVPLVLPGGDRVEVKRIEDVKIRDPLTGSERFFSDGCATISPAMNRHILNYLPRTKGSPTLYQFRMAGAKGMLSVDASLGEDALVLTLRDSMVKFGGGDESYLDICDMANRPLDLVLNRQMIKILEDMGAPDSWFFKLQERAIAEIRLVCNDARRLSKYLEHKSIAEHAAFAGLVRRLHELGIDYKKDRLISSIVEAVVLRELRLLKHKARIPVPLGVTLFGVMDETGFLMEGEVYITYDPDKKRRHMAPPRDRTEVIITRSPALHPGDIQRAVQAVPPPGHPLTYLSNCVVFSQRGLRDLPSQLSGGDLDGDIYNVIWDPDLMISSLHTYQPADYPRVTPVDIGRPVRREDITEFFVKFMRTDQLGVIATRHMILADQRRLGTLDPDAIKLAELHSNAVDFSKSGVDVDLSQMNIRDFKPRFRPDFLEPSAPTSIGRTRGLVEFDALPAIAPAEDHEDDDEVLNYVTFYRSEKLLGRLYRAIDERRIWEQDIRHGEARRIAEGHGDPDIVWQSVATHIRSTLAEWLPDLEWEDKEKVQEAWRIRHE